MELHHNCVIGGAAYGVYRRFGVPKLFRYADHGHWDKIPARCRSHPKEAKFIHKYAPCDNALHRLLRPLYVAKCTGTAIKSATAQGQLAASFSSDSEDQQQLQQHDLDQKHKNSTDVLTRQELRLAKEKERRLYEETDPKNVTEMLLSAVQAILDANPTAATHSNTFGRTPLHLACMDLSPARAEAATLLLKHSPRAALIKDHHGCTAMHYLLKNPANKVPRQLMLLFMNRDGYALERRNNEGQTPLDVFVAFGQDTASVRDDALDICQVLRISTTKSSVDVVVSQS